jgi:hypothetical protein
MYERIQGFTKSSENACRQQWTFITADMKVLSPRALHKKPTWQRLHEQVQEVFEQCMDQVSVCMGVCVWDGCSMKALTPTPFPLPLLHFRTRLDNPQPFFFCLLPHHAA